MKRYLAVFLCLCSAAVCCAATPESVSIKGRVMSESLEPIVGVIVTVKSAADSRVLGNAVSDATGNYLVKVSADSELFVEATHLSYQPYISQPLPLADREMNIQLQDSAISIEEVVIKGTKPFVRMIDGNVVVDATQIPNAESLTLERLLDRVPGVSTQQGLTLNGRGATLYIDGVRQRAGVESAMRAMSGAVVGDVELLSMPTAEYGVTSEAIINVKTKRRRLDGYYMSTVASISRNRKGQLDNYDNVVMVFKKRSITFNTMLSFDTSYEGHSQTDTTWFSTGVIRDREMNLRERLNTVQFLGNLNWESKTGHSLNLNTYIYDDHGRTGNDRKIGEFLEQDYINEAFRTKTRGHDDLYSARLEYKSPDSLRTSGVLSYGILYGGKRSVNDYLTGESPVQYMDSRLDMTGYMHTLKGKLKQDVGQQRRLVLYAGFNATFGRLGDKADYNLTSSPEDNTRSRFTGRENAIDIYLQAKYKLSEKLSVLGYFTSTYTNYDLNLKLENERTRSKYWRHFPYLSLSFSTKNYESTIGFTSSMTRPEYEWMLPGVRYADRYSYTVGNPGLTPVTRKNLVWNNLMWKYMTVQVYYSRIENAIGSVMERIEDNHTVYSYMNYADFDRLSVYASIPYELLGGKLDGEFGIGYTYNWLKRSRNGFIVPVGRNAEDHLRITFDIGYEFTGNFSAKCYFAYFTPSRTLQSDIDDLTSLGFEAAYSCFNNRLSFAVSVYDVFGLRYANNNRKNYFDGNYQRVYWKSDSRTRRVELSARWTINRGEKVLNRAKDVQMDSERFGSQ